MLETGTKCIFLIINHNLKVYDNFLMHFRVAEKSTGTSNPSTNISLTRAQRSQLYFSEQGEIYIM